MIFFTKNWHAKMHISKIVFTIESKKNNFLEQNLKLLLMIKVTVSIFFNFEEISKIEPKKILKVAKNTCFWL